MENRKFNISKSLLQKYIDYKNNKYCGRLFEAEYIDKKVKIKAGAAAELGKWFEFICTGTVNRDGSDPQPDTTKKGDLTAKYKTVEAQKNNFDNIYKPIFDKWNDLNHLLFNETLEIEIEGINYKGIFDVLVFNEEIRDIKTTANLDKNCKWYKYGWGGDISESTHVLQAKMYIWLYWKKYKKILPFFFDIFSTTNSVDCKIIKIEMNETSLISFETELFNLVKKLRFECEIGFEVKPEMKLCSKCPLDCDMRTNIPDIEYYKL